MGEGSLGDALRAHLDAHGEGPYALAFATADADAAASTLRAHGIVARDPRRATDATRAPAPSGGGARSSCATGDTRGVPGVRDRAPLAARRRCRRRRSTAMLRPAIDGVDHVVVMTADADAVIALYRDRLGLRLAFDRTFEQRGLRLLFFRVAGITVELAAPLGAGRDAGSLLGHLVPRRRRRGGARPPPRRRLRRLGDAPRPQAGDARLHRAPRDARRGDAADRRRRDHDARSRRWLSALALLALSACAVQGHPGLQPARRSAARLRGPLLLGGGATESRLPRSSLTVETATDGRRRSDPRSHGTIRLPAWVTIG